MASSRSILHNYEANFKNPYNIELTANALSYKQQKYDAGRAKVDAAIAQITSVQLERPVDRDYLFDRAQTLLADINKFEKLDLSKNSVTTSLTNHINQAIDNNVLNAYEGSLNYQSYLKEVDDVKKNRPGEYNTINDMYGRQNYNRWMQDDTPGSRLGQMIYTPYVDLKKELDDQVQNIYKTYKGRKVTRYDNQGNMYVTEYSGLPKEYIENIVRSSWGEREMQQAQINGWYAAMSNPALMSNQNVNTLISEKNNWYQEQLNSLNAELKGNITDEEKEYINNNIKTLQNEKKAYSDRVVSFFGAGTNENTVLDPIKVGTFMGMQYLENYAVNKYREMVVDNSRKVDESWWKNVEFQQKVAKDAEDLRLKQLDIQVKAAKAGYAFNDAGQFVPSTGGGVPVTPGYTGTGLDSATTVTGIDRNTDEKKLDIELRDKGISASIEYDNSLTRLYESLTPADRQIAIDWTKNQVIPNYSSMTDRDKVLFYLDNNGQAGNEMLSRGSGALENYSKVRQANNLKNFYLNVDERLVSLQNEIYDSAGDALVEQAVRNNFAIVLPNGTSLDAGDFSKLNAHYYIDPNNPKRRISGRDGIIATVMASEVLNDNLTTTNDENQSYESKEQIARSKQRQNNQYTAMGDYKKGIKYSFKSLDKNIVSPTNFAKIKALGRKLGEEVSVNDIFLIDDNGNIRFNESSNSSSPITLNLLKGIEAHENKVQAVKDFTKLDKSNQDFIVDNRWMDDRSVRKLVKGSEATGATRQKILQDVAGTVERPILYVANYNNPAQRKDLHPKFFSLYNSALQKGDGSGPYVKLSDAHIIQAQFTNNSKGDPVYRMTIPGVSGYAEVPEADFVRNGLANTEMARWVMTPDLVKRQEVSYSFPNLDSNKSLSRYLDTRPNINKKYISKQDTWNNFAKDPAVANMLITTQANGQKDFSQYGTAVRNIIEKGQEALSVVVSPYVNGSDQFFQYNLINKDTKENIYTIDLPNVRFYEAIQDNVTMAPQTIVMSLIHAVLAKEQAYQMNTYGRITNDPITPAMKEILKINNSLNNGRTQ